jgi:hypothetical protein
VKDQAVSGIIENPVTDEREPLARWTANYHIYRLISDPGPFSNFASGQIAYVGADNLAIREIQFMDNRVYRIVFDGCDDVEPGLFESERQAPNAGEEVDGDRTFGLVRFQGLSLRFR